ncbi:MAG: HNH endonuclease [Caulobacteraceae bacterium]|nr:HNH endonuclease [Caulobacteraceae bacterium]
MKKNARSVALSEGFPRYVSDRPCKRGHLGERITRTGTCIECRQIKSREIYAANRQQKILERQEYYAKNAESIKEKRRKKYAENPEKELATSRVRSAEWRAANPDKVKAQQPLKSAYKKANRHKGAALLAKRRAAKKQRTPSWLTEDHLWMIEEAYEIAEVRSRVTGISWHVDHICPLQGKTVSGLHVPWNLQVITAAENIAKGNRFL